MCTYTPTHLYPQARILMSGDREGESSIGVRLEFTEALLTNRNKIRTKLEGKGNDCREP